LYNKSKLDECFNQEEILLKALEKENTDLNTMNDNNIVEKVNEFLDANKYIEKNIRKYNFINDKIEDYKIQEKNDNGDDTNNKRKIIEDTTNNHNNNDSSEVISEKKIFKNDNYISNVKENNENPFKNNKENEANILKSNNNNDEENSSWRNEDRCNNKTSCCNSFDDSQCEIFNDDNIKVISKNSFDDDKETINDTYNESEIVKNRLLESPIEENDTKQLFNKNEINSSESTKDENSIIDYNDKNNDANEISKDICKNNKPDNKLNDNKNKNLSDNDYMKKDNENIKNKMNYSMFIENIEKNKNNSENNEILKNIINMRNNSTNEINILSNFNEEEIYEKEDENETLEIIEVESEFNRDKNDEINNEYDDNLINFIKENKGSKLLKNKKMKAKKEFLENQYIILKILEKQYRRKSSLNIIKDTEFLCNINYINVSNAELPQVKINLLLLLLLLLL